MPRKQPCGSVRHSTRADDIGTRASPHVILDELVHSAITAICILIRNSHNALSYAHILQIAPSFACDQMILSLAPNIPSFEPRWIRFSVSDPIEYFVLQDIIAKARELGLDR